MSTRTIERDILALQEAGVPIRGAAGRRSGYSIDPARTLPPVNFTPAEALAVAIELADNSGRCRAARDRWRLSGLPSPGGGGSMQSIPARLIDRS